MRWGILLLILLMGSCAAPSTPYRVSQTIPERPDALLRKLALDVPDDIARLPLITGGEANARTIGAAPAFIATARTEGDAARALDCLTTAIYYEARSEPLDGQRAVAQVVLNRVRDRAFPASVCGVVYQGSNRRTGCQFSFTCDGSMLRPRDPASWARAGLVAAAALAGEVFAPVGSATHYHTTAILPWWAPSLTRLGVVGAHVFYRWSSAMERALAFRQQYDGYEPLVSGGGGITIAASGASAFGVTIHRGGEAPAEPVATADDVAAAVAPANVATDNGVRVHRGVDRRSQMSGSVRIHRGGPMPDVGEPAADEG